MKNNDQISIRKQKNIPLGALILNRGGSVNPKKYQNEVFDLYSIPSYESVEPEVVSGCDIGSSKKIVQTGDVLLSRIVPHIRRAWVVNPFQGRRQIASGEWIVFRSKDINPRYLRYYLLSDIFHRQFMRTVSGIGGSLLRARPSEVAKIGVNLPSLFEQNRIAAILDKAYAIRRKRRQSIQLADVFLRSVFVDMFGDPVLNPKNWKVHSVEKVIKKIAPGWSAKGGNRKRQPNDWGVLKVSAVTSERFLPEECKVVQTSEIKKSMVKPKRGDLLFSRANTKELVAATCLVEHNYERLFLPDKIWKIVPDRSFITSEYLRFVLSSQRFRDKIRKQATGTSGSMLNVSQAKVKQMKLPVPPLRLQDRFSDMLWKTYKVKNHTEKIAVAASKLFNSLSQRAFRGEL